MPDGIKYISIHHLILVFVALSLFLAGCGERHVVPKEEHDREVFIEFEGRRAVLVNGKRITWQGRTTGWQIRKEHPRARRFWFKNVRGVMFEDMWALADYLRPETDKTDIRPADFGIIDPAVGECPFNFHRMLIMKNCLVFEMSAEDYRDVSRYDFQGDAATNTCLELRCDLQLTSVAKICGIVKRYRTKFPKNSKVYLLPCGIRGDEAHRRRVVTTSNDGIVERISCESIHRCPVDACSLLILFPSALCCNDGSFQDELNAILKRNYPDGFNGALECEASFSNPWLLNNHDNIVQAVMETETVRRIVKEAFACGFNGNLKIHSKPKFRFAGPSVGSANNGIWTTRPICGIYGIELFRNNSDGKRVSALATIDGNVNLK